MGRLRKGVSGNPSGRKQGSRNRVSVLCDQIAAGHAEDLLKTLLQRARSGDPKAIEFVLARVWPPRRGRPVMFSMPKMDKVSDLPPALAAVATAISNGTLTPDEASSIAQVLNVQVHAVEVLELSRRVKEIEWRLANKALGPT